MAPAPPSLWSPLGSKHEVSVGPASSTGHLIHFSIPGLPLCVHFGNFQCLFWHGVPLGTFPRIQWKKLGGEGILNRKEEKREPLYLRGVGGKWGHKHGRMWALAPPAWGQRRLCSSPQHLIISQVSFLTPCPGMR